MKNSFWKFGFSYCFRNLWRNRRRTLLTLSTVIVSVVVAIVGQQYNSAVMDLWIKSTRDSGTGDLQIVQKDFDTSTQGISRSTSLVEGNKIEDILEESKDVDVYTKRLELEGMVSSSTKSIYFLGYGISAGFEEKVSPELFTKDAIEGSFIEDDYVDGVILGKYLASTLGVKLNDTITLMVQTIDGGINAEDVKVIGILDISYTEASKRTIYLHIDKVRSLLKADDLYSSLIVRVGKNVNLENFISNMKEDVIKENGKLKAWWDIYPIILNVKTLFQSVVGIISFLLFLSVSISVLSVIYMLIFERTVEIGTLMAIGLGTKGIILLIVLESFFIGLLGSLVGAVIGNIVVFILGFTGIPFDNPLSTGIIYVYPSMSIVVTVVVCCIAILMCSCSALIPGVKASRWNPSQAFRGQII